MRVLIKEMIPDQCSNLAQVNSWNRSGHSHPIFRTYEEQDLTSCEYQLCFLSVYSGHQPVYGTVACVAGIKRGREHARKQGAREEEEKRNLLSSFFPLLARPRIPTFPSPLKRVPRRLEGTEITRCHGKHTQNVKYVQSGLPYTTHASHKSQQRCLKLKRTNWRGGLRESRVTEIETI